MGKAFEKQIKTIESQGERQIKPIQKQEKITTIKKYTYDNEDTPLIFNELIDKRLDEITELDKKVNSDDLIYRYKGNTANVEFDQFDNAFSLLDKIRDGKINLANAKNDQAEFKSDLNEIKKRKQNKIDQKSKKLHCIILKCFTKQERVLLNFLMIILQCYQKQNAKQLKEQV